LRADEQPQLPAEFVRPQLADGLPAVLLEDEYFAEFDRAAVPIGPLKDLGRHRREEYSIGDDGAIYASLSAGALAGPLRDNSLEVLIAREPKEIAAALWNRQHGLQPTLNRRHDRSEPALTL
jgi:hypothetical protein